MTFRIDRRSLLLTGTLGMAAFAIPGFARAASILGARGFTSGVASGEPDTDSMLLWSRYVPADGGAVRLAVEVSATPDFARVVAGGAMVTGPWRDHTAKITVDGLAPGTHYFYRFVAPDGSFSAVGRTRTLPVAARSFTAAVFSCANVGFGYFNAYAHAAARGDLDCAIHLGDYFYEYQTGGYPPAKDLVDNRVPEPANELLTLADYRLRYASYRADRDLQALHAALPMLASRDDHETANDSWEGGAGNHQSNEGDWTLRKLAGMQAWREWMPVGDEPWKAYDLGGLGTFFRTETRNLARSMQPDLKPFYDAADPAAALKAFHDGAWADPAQTMMGTEQELWLRHAVAASVNERRKWQVVGVGTIVGEMRTPLSATDWLSPDADDAAKGRVRRSIAAARAGLPGAMDNWGGYPAARARLLKGAQAAAANLIVLSGDSHNAWAFDLAQDGRAAGVEFAGQAVTSKGFDSAFKTDPKVIAAGMVSASPELKWCDTSRRGYMALTLTPTEARNDWLFCDTVRAPSQKLSVGHTATVRPRRNRMS